MPNLPKFSKKINTLLIISFIITIILIFFLAYSFYSKKASIDESLQAVPVTVPSIFEDMYSDKDYWSEEKWNLDTSYIYIDVIKKDPENRTFLGSIFKPDFLKKDQVMRFNCKQEYTSLVSSMNRVFLGKAEKDPFDYVKDRSVLFAQCFDKSCAEVGKFCYIILNDK